MRRMIGSGIRKFWRTVTSAAPGLKYTMWSMRNPGRTFKDYYVEGVSRALDGTVKHPTLGPHRNLAPKRIVGRHVELRDLIARGVSPKDVFVDYGCGTLRLGGLLIEYLDADRYVGLDIDERILAVGRTQISPEVIATKRPLLDVISKETLSRVAAKGPKWVCSMGVLQHVPPRELGDYFQSLSILIHAGASGFVNAKLAPRCKRVSPGTWDHNFDRLHSAAARHGMVLSRLRPTEELDKLRPTQTFMSLTRAPKRRLRPSDGSASMGYSA
jgi:SAM-dependent methyltransferase